MIFVNTFNIYDYIQNIKIKVNQMTKTLRDCKIYNDITDFLKKKSEIFEYKNVFIKL